MEDRALKEAAWFMGEELLPLLGVEGSVRRVSPTEAVFLEVGGYLFYDSVRVVLMYCIESMDVNETIEALREIFLNRNNLYHGLFTTMDRGGFVSILIFDRKNKGEVFEDFSKSLGETLKSGPMEWSAVFSLEKENIKHSYKTAVDTARYRFVYPEKKDLRYEELNLEERKAEAI